MKICGVTRREDAMHAVRAGADFLGLNLWPGSRRHVDVARARALAAAAREARPDVAIVGVFVDAAESEIALAAAEATLDIVQLHGREPAALSRALAARGLTVWRAAAMAGDDDVAALAAHGADAYLLDTPSAGHGGSGRTFDWRLAAAAVAAGHRVVLAGGLRADNVAEAIAAVAPWAVDVASGVEAAPGVKDPARVSAFVDAAKGAAP
ncbi:MAG TPA: phosphoribosylanthranilate isomerase [Kofleriaceae bacterium]|nr:phosphoribosylanthranilate isomerase [Kofleriaceae bacterium]